MEKSICGLCKQEVAVCDWKSHTRTKEHIKKEHEFFSSQESVELVAFKYTMTKSFLEALNILCGLEKYAIALRKTE